MAQEEEEQSKCMAWYTYLLLLIIYVIYLAFGALVFQAIEQPAEVSNLSEIVSFSSCFVPKIILSYRIDNFVIPSLNMIIHIAKQVLHRNAFSGEVKNKCF